MMVIIMIINIINLWIECYDCNNGKIYNSYSYSVGYYLIDVDNKCHKCIERCDYCNNDETCKYYNSDGYVKGDDDKCYCGYRCYKLKRN